MLEGRMKTVKKVAKVTLASAVLSLASITLTWMMPVAIQLFGLGLDFGFLFPLFWKDDEIVRHCEHRDRIIRDR